MNRLRLRATAVAGGAVLTLAAFTGREPSLLGAGVVIAGMALRVWAAGHLNKNKALGTAGPYAWVRNPCYLGTLIALAGGLITVGAWLFLPVAVVPVAVVYHLQVLAEERELTRRFGERYRAYCAQVPRWLARPRLRGFSGAAWRGWGSLLVKRELCNLGYALAALVLIDLLEDGIVPWLVHGRPLTLVIKELADVTRLIASGHF